MHIFSTLNSACGWLYIWLALHMDCMHIDFPRCTLAIIGKRHSALGDFLMSAYSLGQIYRSVPTYPFCDCCADTLQSGRITHAILWNQIVRVCSPTCLHTLRQIWAPAKISRNITRHILTGVGAAAILIISLLPLLLS